MYGFFANSSKRSLELSRLAIVLEIEGLKMMRNVKTRWMGILPCVSRVQAEYKPLILKMSEDAPSVTSKEDPIRASEH